MRGGVRNFTKDWISCGIFVMLAGPDVAALFSCLAGVGQELVL
jgi:hypothetical protein